MRTIHRSIILSTTNADECQKSMSQNYCKSTIKYHASLFNWVVLSLNCMNKQFSYVIYNNKITSMHPQTHCHQYLFNQISIRNSIIAHKILLQMRWQFWQTHTSLLLGWCLAYTLNGNNANNEYNISMWISSHLHAHSIIIMATG